MPFKLKLKKSRHYNVTSKSLFVIPVHHLLVFDTPTTVDCTLSSESTGQDCLENVCQRLSINQSEFFGLRYVVKGCSDESVMRWVDLDRPLSRQLEKHAASSKLYLRIMYYIISNVSLITDEVTRNYYFLQLKSDVVEGRIACDPKQAVTLAIYCRQAQYESYQNERHTVDYLKNLLPFPKHLIEAGMLETLTEEVLQPNPDIQNLTQSMAEGFFIAACQQLDGYGQELFDAKDDKGKVVTLALTVAGIVVKMSVGTNAFYPWHDISNVVNHKRVFNIECTNPEKNVGFTLVDADTGRYFWKLCVLQHTFFMKYEQNHMNPTIEPNLNLFANVPEDLNESRDNLFDEQQTVYASDSHLATTMWPYQQQQQPLQHQQQMHNSVHHHQQQQQRQQLQQHLSESVVSSNLSLAASQQLYRGPHESTWNHIQNDYPPRNSYLRLVGSNTSLDDHRNQSSSCLDLSNNNIQQDRERLKAFLPGYRQAPDYETAVQQKHRSSSSLLQSQNQRITSDPNMNIYSGSQPDVHRATAITDAIFGHQLQQKYPDVTQTTTSIYQQHFDPSYVGSGVDGLTHQLQLMRLNKPPPSYQANRLSSTSTPDLASHRAMLGYHGAYVSGSSPDLVSSRTYFNPQFMSQQQVYPPSAYQSETFRYRYMHGIAAHGTYENLNYVDENTKTNLLAQKLHQQQNAIAAAAAMFPHPQTTNGFLKHSSHHNGSIEPIYENIPLPWQNENEMRDRTSSIQSAPSVMRFKSQPLLNGNGKMPAVTPIATATTTMTATNLPHDLPNEHRPLSKTSSNPVPAPRHNVYRDDTFNNNDSIPPTIVTVDPNEIIQPPEQFKQNDKEIAMKRMNDGVMHKTKIEITANNSHNDSTTSTIATNRLDMSQSSTITNQTITTTDSGVSIEKSKEKKKKRWPFFGGGGGSTSSKSSSGSADKQKSATLGREKKEKSNASSMKNGSKSKDDEKNLNHRWSTGLPRLQPFAATISKEKLSQMLEEKLQDSQLYIEFEQIPKRKDGARYECALLEENQMKNNDPNFLPYDDNRVRITPSRDNRLGYVNASYISSTVGTKQRFYILCQTPHNTQSLNIFWQCVWEADVYLIVQLSDEMNYIPMTSDKCLDYGQYQLYQEFSQNAGRCTTSKLRLFHTSSKRYRSVWHLKYSKWAEQNCPPEVEHFLDFLKELNSVRLASTNEVPPGHNTNPPVLIHCSDGIGRSGVALTADLLLYTLDHNQDLDIPRVIAQLRNQRDSIIPSLAQYKFIYALLIHSLKQTRLI